jgi:hypothetical protein
VTNAVPTQIVVKLTDPDREALASIMAAIKAPWRPPVTISEAVRAAITNAAERMAFGQSGPKF